MIYHLTRRSYRTIMDDNSTEDDAINLCVAIEKWEVSKILNCGDSEIEKLIKRN